MLRHHKWHSTLQCDKLLLKRNNTISASATTSLLLCHKECHHLTDISHGAQDNNSHQNTMLQRCSLYPLSVFMWRVTIHHWLIYAYQRLTVAHHAKPDGEVRTYQETKTTVFSLTTVSLIAQEIFRNLFTMEVSILYIIILHIPDTLLACYGNDGAHQTIVLRWSGSSHQQGVARIHSNQHMPLTLYLQPIILSNKQTKNVMKLVQLSIKMAFITTVRAEQIWAMPLLSTEHWRQYLWQEKEEHC